MASNLNPTLRQKLNPLLSQPYFRSEVKKAKSNKIKRKIKLGPRHVILSFLLIAGLFFLIQQTCLFLITWDKLEVNRIEIKSIQPGLKHSIQNNFEGKKLGNLLLLDIDRMQKTIKAHTWIKDVHIKKIFPSTVNIEIIERIPIAVIKKGQYYLIDEEGILLQAVDLSEQKELPLITDENAFQSGFEDKFKLALRCLESLSLEQRKLVKIIDVSKYKCVSIKLNQLSPWLILGDDDFSKKIQEYQERQSYFVKFGEIKSINMRFKDRYILAPRKTLSGNRISMSEKEGS
ncbi:MAG: cell division protein FtsQ/DivIB [Acidobacteriota bacterium]